MPARNSATGRFSSGGSGEAARLSVVVDADTSKAESGLQSLGQKVASFGQSFTAGLGFTAGIAAFETGLNLLGQGFGALKSSVIDFNSQLDQSRAVFTRYFEGNQQVAESFLNTLKGFAATTPFEFKDLSPLAARLAAVNVNANDLIPTMRAIGNAASTSGQVSKESVDRIGLAITQMLGKGKVQAEEMNQLVEGGMTDAWHVLAQQIGVSDAEVRKMVSSGQVLGTTMVDALRKSYENAGLMETASKSLGGALSTISDVGTQAFAEIGRSVYDLATSGANQLANFLSSEQFQTWAQAAKVGVDSVVSGITGLLTVLAPVGQTIATAFAQLTSGDFSGAFATLGTGIQTALGSAVTSIQTFASQMFGAGTNLVNELAGGIVDGANGLLQGAIDSVAQMIASFLIGNSPPPAGPLAQIREGGANVIAAWGEGAAGAADGAVKPAADKIAGGLAQLKESGRGVDEAIRDIGKSIADLDSQTHDLKFRVDDIKDAYKDQLDPLEAQLKALTNVKDIEAERQKIEFSLEEAQLRQAEIAAQGDPVRRAELQDRLASLKSRQDEVKTAREIADAEKAVSGSAKDKLKDQLESTRLAREEHDLRSKLKDAKGDEKKGIQARLDELELRKKIAQADDKEQAEKAKRQREDAQAHLEELNAKKDLDGLSDKGALAAIKKQKDELAARRESFTLQQQQAQLERERAALPIRAEIERVKAEQESTLKPLQDQLDVLGRQKSELSEQRTHYQGIKQDISAVVSAINEQEAASKKAETAAKAAAKNATTPTKAVDKTFTPDAIAEGAIKAAKESGAKLASGIKDGFVGWITQNPLLTAGTLAGALWGAGQGAAIGSLAGSVVPVIGTAIGGLLGAAIGAGIGGIVAGQLAGMLEAKLTSIMGMSVGAAFQSFATEWREAFSENGVLGVVQLFTVAVGDALTTGIPLIAGKLVEWSNTFLDWANDLAGPLLDTLSDLAGGLFDWIDDNAGPIADKLYEWSLAFVDWVGTGGLDMLGKLADLAGKLLSWAGQQTTRIAGKLLDWATAFVSWVGPKIPELLTKLGEMVVKIVEWVGTHAGELADSLGKWALEFINWVGPKIPPLLAELGKLLVELTRWTLTVALPAIAAKLLEWGDAFITWVGPRIGPLLSELGDLLLAVGKWFVTDAIPGILAGAVDMGVSLLTGLWTGITQQWTWLVTKLGEFAGWIIDKVKEVLGIASPSTVFTEIGEMLVRGLWDGILNLWDKGGDTLKGWLEGFGGLIQKAFGWTGQALTWVSDLLDIGKAVLGGLWTGIKNLWAGDGGETLEAWLKAFGGLVVAAIEEFGGGTGKWLVDTGAKVLGGLKTGWDTMWSTGANGAGSIKAWLGNFGGTVVDVFTNYADGPVHWLVQVGSDIVEGLRDGIGSMLGDGPGQFWGWLKQELIDKIPQQIRTLLNLDADTGALAMVGERMVRELEIGISNRWPSLSDLWKRLSSSLGSGHGLTGVDLRLAIQGLGSSIGGDEFGRAAAAVAVSEGALDNLDEPGSGGARGPFQFDPGGELQNFARALGVSLQEAGDIAGQQPLRAADWALEGYLGDAIREGMERGLHGAELANYASRFGQRPHGSEIDDPNDPDAFWARAGRAYRDLFPGMAQGGIVWPTAGGSLVRVAEAGRPEMITPLPRDWQSGTRGGGGDTIIHLTIQVANPLASPRQIADAVVPALEHAVRTRRLSPSILGRN